MSLTQGVHQYDPIFNSLGLELYSNAGTPTASGPKKGALVVDTTNGILYINTGTVSSATWNAVGSVTPGEITLAEGSILIGNASGVATSLDAKTSGQILVGNGTTATSVAVSGDATLSSAGAVTIATGAVEDSMIEGLAAGQFIVGTDGTAANNAKVTMSGGATMTGAGVVTVSSASGTWGTGGTTTSSGPGAVAITGAIHEITTTGADALTLADGAEGQHLHVVMVADGGDGTLTPTNLAGAATTITFDAVGDAVHLLFTAGAWYVVGVNGAVVA